MPERHVFKGMGYTGQNVSPHLAWNHVPINTQSFVVTCYDPDAPTGCGWWHWIVANIPCKINFLLQNCSSNSSLLPKGAIQTRTDFGQSRYDGAAPPKGESHRYIFTVHALNVDKIAVDNNSSGAMVAFNVHFNKLESASITVIYP
ncbi:hypothetical protein HHS_07420 [Candidatus Pantoea carbekii]|uniref:Uncharacterized protein n=2 Tax=Candidatus Pantoea carbekii TaxID=1235990 RepID=U3U8B4_9GAMM|nr:hypothetical protein HHS_07420 [Candidatus Pantoea carbekii]